MWQREEGVSLRWRRARVTAEGARALARVRQEVVRVEEEGLRLRGPGRLPVIGRPNADILHHGPPPTYAHGREAVGGAEAWTQVHPGVVRGARAAAGL